MQSQCCPLTLFNNFHEPVKIHHTAASFHWTKISLNSCQLPALQKYKFSPYDKDRHRLYIIINMGQNLQDKNFTHESRERKKAKIFSMRKLPAICVWLVAKCYNFLANNSPQGIKFHPEKGNHVSMQGVCLLLQIGVKMLILYRLTLTYIGYNSVAH